MLVAARDLPSGTVASATDFVAISLPHNANIEDSLTGLTSQDFDNLTALIDIPQGTPVTPNAFHASLTDDPLIAGKTLTSVTISNMGILAHVSRGTTLDLYASHDTKGTRVAHKATVIRVEKPQNHDDDQVKGWTQQPPDPQNYDDSSTVLIAVTPDEAQELAAYRDWDGALMAAIVT